MDRRRVLLITAPLMLLVAAGGGCATDARKDAYGAAQRAVTGSDAQRQVTLDNEAVRVVESTYPVGTAVPMHNHDFPRVLYVIDGGRLQTTGPDGATNTREVHPGDTLWRSPENHRTRNVGSTPVRIVEVEIKGKSEGVSE